MSDPLVAVVPDAGLGNSAYLVDLGDGRALAIDASRDLRSLRAEAGGLHVAYAADTHLHADFLSARSSSPPPTARRCSRREPASGVPAPWARGRR